MANDEKALSSRLAPVITVVILLVAGSVGPKGGAATDAPKLARKDKAHSRQEHRAKRAHLAAAAGVNSKTKKDNKPAPDVDLAIGGGDGTVDLAAYKDLGSWIDIYDDWVWAHPTLAVRKLHARGARTIFLQTSNYGADDPIFMPGQTARFLKAAHQRNMKVVSWYVPSFDQPQIDFHRSKAAIRFEADGHRFDSFGLDIEATVVGNINLRNKRLLKLSKQIRKLVGPDYPLGAITPDAVEALYWPDFPYKSVNEFYDVFVPMGYFSFRHDGYKAVKKYTLTSIRNIRRETQNPDVPIHLIGGIGGETEVPEVKGFVRAVRGNDVLGASYYDFAVTSEEEWKQLETIVPEAEPDPPAAEPEPEPEETVVPVVPEAKPTAIGVPVEPKEAKPKPDKNRTKKESSRKHRKGTDRKERSGQDNVRGKRKKQDAQKRRKNRRRS